MFFSVTYPLNKQLDLNFVVLQVYLGLFTSSSRTSQPKLSVSRFKLKRKTHHSNNVYF